MNEFDEISVSDLIKQYREKQETLTKRALEKLEIMKKQNGLCYICDSPANTIDHLIPQFLLKITGREDSIENKRLCCSKCNTKLSSMQFYVSMLISRKFSSDKCERKAAEGVMRFFRSDFGKLAVSKK